MFLFLYIAISAYVILNLANGSDGQLAYLRQVLVHRQCFPDRSGSFAGHRCDLREGSVHDAGTARAEGGAKCLGPSAGKENAAEMAKELRAEEKRTLKARTTRLPIAVH